MPFLYSVLLIRAKAVGDIGRFQKASQRRPSPRAPSPVRVHNVLLHFCELSRLVRRSAKPLEPSGPRAARPSRRPRKMIALRPAHAITWCCPSPRAAARRASPSTPHRSTFPDVLLVFPQRGRGEHSGQLAAVRVSLPGGNFGPFFNGGAGRAKFPPILLRGWVGRSATRGAH
jgi:hypothetical protein